MSHHNDTCWTDIPYESNSIFKVKAMLVIYYVQTECLTRLSLQLLCWIAQLQQTLGAAPWSIGSCLKAKSWKKKKKLPQKQHKDWSRYTKQYGTHSKNKPRTVHPRKPETIKNALNVFEGSR